MGDGVPVAGDGVAQTEFGVAVPAVVSQQGQDERIAEKGHLGAPLVAIRG
jgi:hypothetical protein